MRRKVSIFTAFTYAQGQTLDELKSKKGQSEEEISYTSELIDQTKARQEATMQDLLVLNHRIEIRNELIHDINEEINLLNEDLIQISDTIVILERKVQKLKDEYGRIIENFYKHYHHHNYLAFLFSAESFNQGYKRLKYLREYTDYRRRQKEEIIQTRRMLFRKMNQLEENIQQKEALVHEKQRENIILRKEKDNQGEMLDELKKKEKTLKQKLEKQKRIADRLEKEIEAFIKREIARRDKEDGKVYRLTPAEKIISNQFSDNQGGLPWPTERGIITGKFGEHNHPVLKGIKIVNNGIDITTQNNSEVRAIFKGEVKRIATIPGANKIVIVRHGEYLSVYSNLREVTVEAGTMVDIKERLGYVHHGEGDDNAVIHLEIWKENEKLNPAFWIQTN